MRHKIRWSVLLGAAMFASPHHSGRIWATPANDRFNSRTLYVGSFGEIDVSDHFVQPKLARRAQKSNLWVSRQKTKGSSELYVQSNVWQSGGSTGWHTHPGHSLIIVTKGTVTAYEGDDPECKPHIYNAGMGFVDRGGGHVHIIRNEGNHEARTVSVQLIPAGLPRRMEARDPGNCPFR